MLHQTPNFTSCSSLNHTLCMRSTHPLLAGSRALYRITHTFTLFSTTPTPSYHNDHRCAAWCGDLGCAVGEGSRGHGGGHPGPYKGMPPTWQNSCWRNSASESSDGPVRVTWPFLSGPRARQLPLGRETSTTTLIILRGSFHSGGLREGSQASPSNLACWSRVFQTACLEKKSAAEWREAFRYVTWKL